MKRGDHLALAFLTLLPFGWYFEPIFTDACYYLGDLTAQYNPWWTFGHDALRSGTVPLWNPFTLAGTPYHVNPENSLFYPLKFPLIFLSFFKAAAVLRALDAVVASLGMYLLIRSYRMRPMAGLLGALMFAYGGFMAYKFLHIPYINTAVWFPWQLLLLRRLARRATVGDCIGLALVTAASFLGGSPGIFLVCQLTLAIFLSFAALNLIVKRNPRQLTRLLGALSVSALLVLGLTCVTLAPAFDFIRQTPRSEGVVDVTTFRDFVLTGPGLETLVFPFAQFKHGAPHPPLYPIPFLNVPYLGSLAVLLMLLGLTSRRYRLLYPPAITAATFGVLAALGTRSGFLPWLSGKTAIFDWFRWPHDYLLMAYLVLPLLAAAGFSRLLGDVRRRKRVPWLPAAGYLVLGAIVVRHPTAVVAAGVGLLAIGVAWWLTRSDRHRFASGWAFGVIGLVLVDLWVFGGAYRAFVPREALATLYEDDAILYATEHADFDRVAVAAPAAGTHFAGEERRFARRVALFADSAEPIAGRADLDLWMRRAAAGNQARELWSRRTGYHNMDQLFAEYPINAAMIHRYHEVSGYDPFTIARVKEFYRAVPQRRTWDLLGVRYVVSPSRWIDPDLVPVHQGERLRVYENRTAMPRVFVPATAEWIDDDRRMLRRIAERAFDPRSTVLLEGPPAAASGPPGPAGEATVVDHQPDRITIDATLDRDGYLVLHDAFSAGWKVRVDGESKPIERANHAFRAVRLSPGSHRVEWTYRPTLFYVAAWISGSFWVGCLATVGFRAQRSSAKKPRRSAPPRALPLSHVEHYGN